MEPFINEIKKLRILSPDVILLLWFIHLHWHWDITKYILKELPCLLIYTNTLFKHTYISIFLVLLSIWLLILKWMFAVNLIWVIHLHGSQSDIQAWLKENWFIFKRSSERIYCELFIDTSWPGERRMEEIKLNAKTRRGLWERGLYRITPWRNARARG